MTIKLPLDRSRAFRLAGALVGLAVALGACKHTDDVVAAESFPDDYRLRHPIADRGSQSFARDLRRPGAGRPVRRPARRRDRAGADLAARGHRRDHRRRAGRHAECARGRRFVPGNSGDAGCRRRAAARDRCPQLSSGRSAHDGDDPAELSEDLGDGRSLRRCGPRISAPRSTTGAISKTSRTTISAAPISATWRRWSTIRPTWCSRERETPAYTTRRTTAFDKYRKGTSTATTYPEADKAKLSDTGK